MNFKRLEEIAYGLLHKRGEKRSFHVAFLIKKGRIHTISNNESKTHTFMKQFPYFPKSGLHAELSCFIRAGQEEYSDFKMCVCRINRNHKLDISKPCFACATAAKQLGIKELYFSTKEETWDVMYPQKDNLVFKEKAFYKERHV
jgi:tRNA(Arg) A34 adenosine deaminase TadA